VPWGSRDGRVPRYARAESGQAALLFLGVLAALLAGTLILVGFGQALGTRGKHQRAADLAAVSAAQVMRDNYARLFQPPFLRAGVRNPRHLSTAAYLALARAAAQRGARRNGLPSARLEGSPAVTRGAAQLEVSFPGGGFAPTRVAVAVRGGGDVRLAAGRRPDRIEVEARATAELVPDADLGLTGLTDGGGYDGPLAYRQGKPMRPDVALAFDRMAAAARREAGLFLSITSAYRSDAEQAVLWAANPDPKWVAPPGRSLHRYGTELDLGPPGAYDWLAANSERFGFIRRYSWEPWHYGLPLHTNPTSDWTDARSEQSRIRQPRYCFAHRVTAGPSSAPFHTGAAAARSPIPLSGAPMVDTQQMPTAGVDPLRQATVRLPGFIPSGAGQLRVLLAEMAISTL
jgi:hypothetical protein